MAADYRVGIEEVGITMKNAGGFLRPPAFFTSSFASERDRGFP
ncbi:hypothetical protein PAMC26510_31360 [Caballeronia sordidicola]|uniref:Uncharacterized protein n=1 Tax=Caballeronia sordidicola TaxID=196367 RepID=A0A242M7M6_CABSO|nr:hypothetical protein PAMC26510_31360 [Caballeronia sordidicola]